MSGFIEKLRDLLRFFLKRKTPIEAFAVDMELSQPNDNRTQELSKAMLEEGEATMGIIGITDQPLSRDGEGLEKDSLEVYKYSTVLADFIVGTNTPMTIGVQGEWGSGKTSLLKLIQYHLELKDQDQTPPNDTLNIKQVEINAWEHSLRRGSEETMLKIVQDICEQIIEINTTKIDSDLMSKLKIAEKENKEEFEDADGVTHNTAAIREQTKNDSRQRIQRSIFKWGQAIGKTAIAAIPGINGKSAYETLEGEIKSENADDGIKSLRKSLIELLAPVPKKNLPDGFLNELEKAEKDNQEFFTFVDERYSTTAARAHSQTVTKYVVYIDDLDRIPPPRAIEILELLKNVFDLKHCVFVLAIDYNVVVKGLKDKFGGPEEDNEWEFRAFFDKIIQLPFYMPKKPNRVGKFVHKLLTKMAFSIDGALPKEEIDGVLKAIINYTTQPNPRAIIRLVNSVKLIDMLSKAEAEPKEEGKGKEAMQDEDRLLLFAVCSVQVAYPDIYEVLRTAPKFIDWSLKTVEDYYASIEHVPEEESRKRLKEDIDRFENSDEVSESFDDDWEKSLYRICYAKKRTKSRVFAISGILNEIQKIINKFEAKQDKQLDSELENWMQNALLLADTTKVASGAPNSSGQPPTSGAAARHASIKTGGDHWAGEHADERYAFWRYLSKVWLGRDVPDDEKVYLPIPKKCGLEQSVFYFTNPRLSQLLRPGVGDCAGFGKGDVQLYLGTNGSLEIRIRHNAIDLYQWLKSKNNQEQFCHLLNSKLEYKDSDKEIELEFIQKSAKQRDQIKLTSKFLKALWAKDKGTDPSKEYWPEYAETLKEITPWFEEVTFAELKRFKEEGMA